MESWQVHKLVETSEDGKKRPLGGAIVDLPVSSALGQLDSVEVRPTDEENMQQEFWTNQYVRLQLADRMVWLDPEETGTLIQLLQTALQAAEENVRNAKHDH